MTFPVLCVTEFEPPFAVAHSVLEYINKSKNVYFITSQTDKKAMNT